jgi:signal peptidase I
MNLDFAAILVAITAASGAIWLFDHLVFAKARAERAAQGREAKEPVLVEYARSFFPVLFVILILRSFLAEPFRIPSGSMMPTLLDGDFILVNKYAYGLRLPVLNTRILELGAPERGDVVVFKYPVNPRQDYIKRVVGLPGDEVVYRNKVLYINGEEVPLEPIGKYIGEGSGRDMTGAEHLRERLGPVEHEILRRPTSFMLPRSEGAWTVPEGAYFVMGDNRDNSEDSRFWGFVEERHLVGRAFFIWMNWDGKAGGVDFSRVFTRIR